MTKEEFVRKDSWILAVIRNRFELTKAEKDYLNILIEVLEQEPCEDCISRGQAMNALNNAQVEYDEYYKGLGQAKQIIVDLPSVQPKTDGDCISRQAVLDHIYGANGLEGFENSNVFEKHYADFIKSLPSAKPQEPKNGHWITQWNVVHQKEYYYCSECREEFSYDGETGIKMNDYLFCPNCGARMVESQESELENPFNDSRFGG